MNRRLPPTCHRCHKTCRALPRRRLKSTQERIIAICRILS